MERNTTQAITKAPEPGSNLPIWASEAIKGLEDPSKYELLLPALPVNSALGYGHVPSVSVVTVSPNPLDGDVFKVGSKPGQGGFVDVYAYAKPALLRMAGAAGISINTQRVDRGTDRDYCEIKATGAMKNESGTPIFRSATKAFHMEDVSAEAWRNRVKRNEMAQANKKRSDAQMKEDHAAEMTAFRKHLLRRVEAGAITAVIRELLGIKGGLTRDQVAKPKVILRVDFRPDASDPEVKRFLLARADASTMALYGLPGAAEPTKREMGEAEVVEDLEPDEETIRAQARARELEEIGASERERPTQADRDWLTETMAGFEALGISAERRKAIILEAGGDMEKAFAIVNSIALGEREE